MSDLLNDRQKTHGDYADTASTAQAIKDEMRRGKNWKNLDDMQRETLEMVATKIGRILSGNPHEVDHWKDGAGYFQLIVNAYNAVECDPIRPHGERNPGTPALAPVSCVWPDEEEQP